MKPPRRFEDSAYQSWWGRTFKGRSSRRHLWVQPMPPRPRCDIGQDQVHYRYKAAKQKIRREKLKGAGPALCMCGSYVIITGDPDTGRVTVS